MATKLTDPLTYVTSADQSAAQYLFLRATGDRTVATCNTLGQRAVGIQDDKPAAATGSPVAVATAASKRPLIKLGATLSAGAEVTSSAAGKAVAAASGHAVNGLLVEGGVDGDIVPIEFTVGRVVP